jgi:hypothetical protein
MTQRHASARFTKNLHNVADPWTALQTFNAGIDITHADGITLQNDETIKNSTNGLISLSGNLAIPDGGTIGTATDTDSITIASAGAVTFSQDVFTAAGLVVGHTAQMTSPNTSEFQVLGTGTADSSMILGYFAADDNGPTLWMVKGRDAIATTTTALSAEDQLGSIEFAGADATNNDFASRGARIVCNVDGTPGSDDMPGRLGFFTTADGSASPTERMRISSTGAVFINDSSHANVPVGLCINQGAEDNFTLALKSSDLNTGLTSAPFGHNTDVDDYFTVQKASGTIGGVRMQIMAEDAALSSPWVVQVWGGTADTNKTSDARGLISFYATEHDGSNTIANVTADGNLFSVQGNVSGNLCRFLVDEDGQIYATANGHTGDISVGALADSYDDAQLLRAFDHAKSADGAMGLIRDKWDEFIQYNEQDLIDAGVLGATLAEGGLLSVTGLQRLHNGAIWQGYVRQQEMQTRIESLEQKLLALGA